MSLTEHCTRYVWLFAMVSKETKMVAQTLIPLFCASGYPTVLQSDDKEKVFVGLDLVTEINKSLPNIIMVNGRPKKDCRNLTQTIPHVKNCSSH